MVRKKVQHFHKTTEDYEIDFIVGIDDNPRHAKNAMFYIRMESFRKKKGTKDRAREIWLSSEELERLGVLMTMASGFWKKHTLAKNTNYARRKIAEFIEKWKMREIFRSKTLKSGQRLSCSHSESS